MGLRPLRSDLLADSPTAEQRGGGGVGHEGGLDVISGEDEWNVAGGHDRVPAGPVPFEVGGADVVLPTVPPASTTRSRKAANAARPPLDAPAWGRAELGSVGGVGGAFADGVDEF